jgi:low-density lipoprotein receptor-related protein 4
VTNTKIYWTDWKTNALHSAMKANVTSRTIIAGNLEGLMDVKVVDSYEQLEDNACKNSNGGCSHLCLRKPVGYSCQCPTGVKMKADGRNCEDLPSSYLLIALRSGIGRISLDTPEMFDVVLPIDGVHGAVVVDYHHSKNWLFYADVNADAIKRVNMKNYNDIKTIVSTGLNTPNGIAVDWVADNIYWSDSALKMIEVSRLDGAHRKTLLRENLDDVRSMILYKNLLFFADWGHAARIERSLLDGSERKVIVNSDLGFPTGLAIDFEARKLFWADALHDRVETSDFDGKKRNKIIMHAEHPFGFTLTNSYWYFTDWFNKSVIRIPRHSNGNPEEVRHNLRGALEIRSVSAERQPKYFNPCNESNGGCTHLCLYLGGKKYVCECPNFADIKVCKREIRESSAKPPENDEFTDTPTSTEGHPPVSKANDSSLMLGIVIFMTLLLLLVMSAIICKILKLFSKKVF